WEDSRTALGLDDSGVERELRGNKKYFVPVRSSQNPTQSRPLRRVYQLHRVPNSISEVTRLPGTDPAEVLLQNVYPPGLPEHLGYQTQVFAVCTAVARDVPIFRFSRPCDFTTLDQGIEVLENHLSKAC